MSIKVMSRVWAHSQQRGGELLVELALADFSNDQGECWPSIPVLALKARLTERQTRRVLINLEGAGEIRRVMSNGGRNRRNRYFITVTENPDIITGKELQGKNNPVICDTKTLTPMSGALNRHRTVNKSTGAKAPDSFPNKRSGKRSAARVDRAPFEQFYSVYPNHVGREPALKAWDKLNPDTNLQAKIFAAIEAQEQWRDDQAANPKAFIPEWPYPATWLNQKRWTDELPANGKGNAKPAQMKDLGDGFVEVDGRRMDRQTAERRYGQAAI